MAQCVVRAEVEAGEHKLGQLLSAYSDFVSHIVTISYGRMHERDQASILHLLTMAAYQPQESEMDAFAGWAQNQLECTSNSSALSYHLLSYLKVLSGFYEFRSTKLVPIVNFYLLHEDFQVATAAQNFLALLIAQNNAYILQAIHSENSGECAIESFLDMVANSNNQHGESDAFSQNLDTLLILQSSFHHVLEIHINDICQSLCTLAIKFPDILAKTLQTTSEIVNDTSTFNTLSSDHWAGFFEKCSVTCTDRLDLTGLLFDVARGVNRSFDPESSALLYSALDPLLMNAFSITKDALYNSSEWSIEPVGEALEAILKFAASLREEEIVQHVAINVFETFFLENINELVKYPLIIDIALDGFVELVVSRKAMLPHLVGLLASSSLFSVLATVNSWNPRNWRLHRLVSSILNAIFAVDPYDACTSWSTVLCTSFEDAETKRWVNLQGGLYDLDVDHEKDVLLFFVDLAFVALLCGDHPFIAYLLDSKSEFGQMSRSSPWKVRLRWTLNRIFAEDVVYALSYEYLVRVCYLWASCCVDFQDPTVDTNTWLLSALAGRTSRIDVFVPPAFFLVQDCSLFPDALITWMVDHLADGMSVPILTIVKETRQNSHRSQWLHHCFLKVASTLPKFSTLLTNAYANNTVSQPILAPLAALEIIAELCVLPSSASSSPSSHPSIRVTSMAKILSRASFPLTIPKSWLKNESNQPSLPLASLLQHITVVRQMLLAEVEEIASLGDTRSSRPNAAVFAKYWKSLESLSLACHTWSQTDEAKAGSASLWSLIDACALELINVWTVLFSFFRPPADLVKKLIASPMTSFLWRAFRYATESTGGVEHQAIALVSRMKKKKLFESSLGAQHASVSLPAPSQQLLDAILISVHQTIALGEGEATLSGASLSKRILLSLQALDADRPFSFIILLNSLTDSLLRLAELLKREGAACSSNEESQLLFLTATSAILNESQCTTSSVVSEMGAVSLMRLACCSPPELWLKLPQTLHVLSLVISFPSSPVYGNIFASCFIFAVVLACSRLPSDAVPKQISSLITSPRLVRTLLLTTGDRSSRINLATLYEMMRCGMWKTALKRAGAGDSKSFVSSLTSLLTRLQHAEPSSASFETNKWKVLSIGGVMLTESIINPLELENVSTRDEMRTNALILQQWLRI